MIVALAGGVGAARFLTGLTKLIPQEDLKIIANTGDDIELLGLHISPDIDILAYTLAGIVDENKGWGIRGDTFQCLNMLKKHGHDAWFNLGDRDLATHIYRTNRLRQGASLSQVTNEICNSLSLKIEILPMTDDKFETKIQTEGGVIHFEEYFVKRQAKDKVLGVEFVGATTAKPSAGVIEAIMNAKRVLVCPSNPIVSIGTILAVDGIRDALRRTDARVVGISPIVGGLPIKGPADKLLRGLGYDVSAYSVASLHSDFLDGFIIDTIDEADREKIEALGIEVEATNIIMRCLEDKISLAKTALQV